MGGRIYAGGSINPVHPVLLTIFPTSNLPQVCVRSLTVGRQLRPCIPSPEQDVSIIMPKIKATSNRISILPNHKVDTTNYQLVTPTTIQATTPRKTKYIVRRNRTPEWSARTCYTAFTYDLGKLVIQNTITVLRMVWEDLVWDNRRRIDFASLEEARQPSQRILHNYKFQGPL